MSKKQSTKKEKKTGAKDASKKKRLVIDEVAVDQLKAGGCAPGSSINTCNSCEGSLNHQQF